MNIKSLCVLAGCLAVWPVAAAQQTAVLTLDDCLRIALAENPTVKVADMEVRRADYSRKDVIGQLLPTIDFGANYSRTIAKQTMYMNMDGLGDFGGMGGGAGAEGGEEPASRATSKGKGDGGLKVGLDNSYSLGFQGSLPLIAPQLWKSVQLSDKQIVYNLEAARQSRQALVSQVKSAYYAHLLALDSRKVIQESYDMADLTYNTYKKLYEAGAASDYDVLRTSVAVKNVEPQLMQADIAIKQTRLQLMILMGVEAGFEFEIADRLSNYEDTMYETALTSLSRDYADNADLKLLDLNTEILGKNLAIQKLSFSPTLALTANYNWTSMSNGSPFKNFRWNPYSAVGLSLSVPIFRGGTRLNSVKSTQLQLDELALQRTNLERSVAMQVDVAIDNIKVNVKQIASCSESVRQAERAHSIQEQSFDIGATTYLNLRDSELALTQARLAYYQAIYNYLIAGSELELLQGSAPIDKYTDNR